MTARLALIDTIGATAPEFVAAALSRRADAVVLPGLSPIRDRAVLYRGHDLASLSATEVFDRLWMPSAEPSGRVWAGVLRDASPAERERVDLAGARRRFAELWQAGGSYLKAIAAFVAATAPSVGAHKEGARIAALAGAPFLRILDPDELCASDVRVLDSRVPLPLWLALASARGVVNCADALHYWVVGRLQVELARQRGVAISPVDAAVAGREGALPNETLSFLGLDCNAPMGPFGPWQRVFDAQAFSETEALATALSEIFAGDPLYEAAARIDAWIEKAVLAHEVRALMAHYDSYWRATAHVHFDTSGPLEQAISAAALAAGELDAERDVRDFAARLPQAFYHDWIRFRSYSFERPAVDLDVSLGPLESGIPLPRAGYFAFAAVAYLERCVETQSKWFDSYASVASSDLYRRLCAPDYEAVVARHGLGARLEAIGRMDAETGARARGKFGA